MVVPFTVELGTLDVESGHLGERDGYTVGVSGQCRIHGAVRRVLAVVAEIPIA
jgi:hypothetical protein